MRGVTRGEAGASLCSAWALQLLQHLLQPGRLGPGQEGCEPLPACPLQPVVRPQCLLLLWLWNQVPSVCPRGSREEADPHSGTRRELSSTVLLRGGASGGRSLWLNPGGSEGQSPHVGLPPLATWCPVPPWDLASKTAVTRCGP